MNIKVSYKNLSSTKTLTQIFALMDTKQISFSEGGFLIRNLYKKIKLDKFEEFNIMNIIKNLEFKNFIEIDSEFLKNNYAPQFSRRIGQLKIDIKKKIILEIINDFYSILSFDRTNRYKIHKECIIDSFPFFLLQSHRKLIKELVEEGFLEIHSKNFYKLRKELISNFLSERLVFYSKMSYY